MGAWEQPDWQERMDRCEVHLTGDDFLTFKEMRTAIRQLQQPWRGIESAPKDGTEIDVWVGGEFPRRFANVSWREPNDSEWWVHGGDTIETPDATWHDCFGPFGKEDQPTHWQPLPTPPETER